MVDFFDVHGYLTPEEQKHSFTLLVLRFLRLKDVGDNASVWSYILLEFCEQIDFKHALGFYDQFIHWLYVDVLRRSLPKYFTENQNYALFLLSWLWPSDTYGLVKDVICPRQSRCQAVRKARVTRRGRKRPRPGR